MVKVSVIRLDLDMLALQRSTSLASLYWVPQDNLLLIIRVHSELPGIAYKL